MLWYLIEQWFERHAQTIAIIEAGILLVSWPVAFCHWLTLRDRHDVLIKQNDALLSEIKNMKWQFRKSQSDFVAPVSPDVVRHISNLVEAASSKALEPTNFERVMNWLWRYLVKPIAIASWGILLISGIVWVLGL